MITDDIYAARARFMQDRHVSPTMLLMDDDVAGRFLTQMKLARLIKKDAVIDDIYTGKFIGMKVERLPDGQKGFIIR